MQKTAKLTTIKATALQRFFSSTLQNLSTQSLLLALGMGAKKTIAASAAINWWEGAWVVGGGAWVVRGGAGAVGVSHQLVKGAEGEEGANNRWEGASRGS